MHIEIIGVDIINGERVLHELTDVVIVHSPQEIDLFQKQKEVEHLVFHPEGCKAFATYRADEPTNRLIKQYFFDQTDRIEKIGATA